MFLSKTEVFLRIFRKTYTMQRNWTKILLINFHSPWKHQKNMDFLMISGGIEGICLNSVRFRSKIKRRSLNFTRLSSQTSFFSAFFLLLLYVHFLLISFTIFVENQLNSLAQTHFLLHHWIGNMLILLEVPFCNIYVKFWKVHKKIPV